MAINIFINRMNYYKKKNYTNNLVLEDYSNENKKKIEILNDEIKKLNNQLEKDTKCIYEKNLLNKEYKDLKKITRNKKNKRSKRFNKRKTKRKFFK